MTRSALTKKRRYGGGAYEPDGCCCIRGCGREIWGHEFCRSHYQAWRQNGHPLYFKNAQLAASTAKTSMREYKSWWAARKRCINPAAKQWPDYGGRGIRMCERWTESFEAFLADMGPAPSPKHTLDRQDNDGHYEPGNCRWATKAEQNRNTRATVLTAEIVADGKARKLRGETVAAIARDHNVSYYALVQALHGASWTDIEPAGSA